MLSGIITMYIVFLLMFYGVRAVGAGAFDLGSTLEGLLHRIHNLDDCDNGVSELAYNVSNEAQTGHAGAVVRKPHRIQMAGIFLRVSTPC